MPIARNILLALFVIACSEPAATPPPPGPTPPGPTPPAATHDCATDADCRLEDASGCQCIGAHVLDPVGPGCPHPCFAPPCLGRVAACDLSTHRCVPRAVPAPPTSGVTPPS